MCNAFRPFLKPMKFIWGMAFFNILTSAASDSGVFKTRYWTLLILNGC